MKARMILLSLIAFWGMALESTEDPSFSNNNRIKQIDVEIERLEVELHAARKKALEKEMKAQVHRLDNWHEYAETLEEEETEERRIIHIKERVKALLEEKRVLLKTNPRSLNDR